MMKTKSAKKRDKTQITVVITSVIFLLKQSSGLQGVKE
jgi:hypothetical protein